MVTALIQRNQTAILRCSNCISREIGALSITAATGLSRRGMNCTCNSSSTGSNLHDETFPDHGCEVLDENALPFTPGSAKAVESLKVTLNDLVNAEG